MGAAGEKNRETAIGDFSIERDEFVADRRPRPSKPESERQMAYRASIIALYAASPVSFIYIQTPRPLNTMFWKSKRSCIYKFVRSKIK